MSGQVVGIDLAEEAIEHARQAGRHRGDQHTRFEVGDVFEMEAELGQFDVVHAHQVLQHLPDPVALLQLMGRLCAPGGIVVAREADYGAMAWYPESPGMELWRSVYCQAARAHGGEPDAGRRLRSWCLQAGLSILTAGGSSWTYASEESTSWWGESQAQRVLGSNFASRAASRGITADQLNSMAEDWRAWGQHPAAWFMLPHGEVIASPKPSC